MKKISLLLVLFCSSVLLVNGQSITKISPLKGSVGSTVTLTGDFNPVLEKNCIYFGDVKATVLSGTTTQLKVEVPVGSTTNPISISYNNKISKTNAVFCTTFLPTVSLIDSTMFSELVALKLDYVPSCFTSGDFDNDGYIDIAIASNSESLIHIYKNYNKILGEFNPLLFEKSASIISSSSMFSLKSADIDGDGKLDLLCLNDVSNSFSVYKNNCLNYKIEQTSFSTKLDFSTGQTPRSFTIADVNGDLKLDVVVANYNGQSVSIYQNKTDNGVLSNLTFKSSFQLPVGDQPVDVVVSTNFFLENDKFNQNKSNNYIFVANYNNQSISIFKLREFLGNLPDGLNDTCYTAIDLLLTDSEPSSLAVEDLNNDGLKELIVCNNQSANLSVYNGLSTTGVYPAYSNNLPKSVKICDLNGDGVFEIININSSDNNISIFQNKSTTGSKFTNTTISTKVSLTQGLGTIDLLVSDFDNDGKSDLVTLDAISNQLSFRRNIAGGVINVKENLYEVILKSKKISEIQSVVVKGINVKSNKITISPSGYSVQISLDSLTGYSTTAIDLSPLNDSIASTKIYVRVAVDTSRICSTGKLVFTCANALKQERTFGIKTGIPLLDLIIPFKAYVGDTVKLTGINLGTNILKTKVDFGGVKAKIVSVSDTLIVAIVPIGAINTTVLVNISGLQSTTKNVFYPIFKEGDFLNQYCFTGPYNYNVGYYPSNLTISDFNDDGKQDIIGNCYAGFAMLTNKTKNSKVDSSFKINNSPVGTFTQLAQNDLDGDGRNDLISNSFSSSIWNVFRNFKNTDSLNAISNCEAIVNIKSRGTNQAVLVTDINNDGKLDVLIANNGSSLLDLNIVSVYINKSNSGKLDTNSFDKPFNLVTKDFPSFIASGDLNNDSKSELIIGNIDGVLNIYPNNLVFGTMNSKSFGAPFQLKAKALPSDLEILDINNDGKNDIVLLSAEADVIQFFISNNNVNLSQSSFNSPINIDQVGAPTSFEIKDFDGDAKPDISVAIYNQNKISLYKNIFDGINFSTSSFQPKVEFNVGTAPFDIKVVDIDGDGKPEIVVSNSGESIISVLHNRVTPNAVGILDDRGYSNFELFPNPASGSFKVTITETEKIESIEILDLNGGSVLMMKSIANHTSDVNIENITTGMYLVKVITTTGIGIKKIIIQ